MSLLEPILESTNWLTVILALGICLGIYVFVQWFQAPPGPTGLPYLGYYPFLTETCHDQLWNMSKKYGKVFCFTVTGQLYAHIIDMKTIKEVTSTKSDCFGKRPGNFTFFQDIFSDGVFFLHGEEWKVLKKYFVQHFKEYGMGKKTQDAMIEDCLKKIVTSLKQSAGKNFDALGFFTNISNCAIHQLVFGRVKLDEKDVRDFSEAYRITMEFCSGMRLLLAGPLLKYFLIPFAPNFRPYREYKWKTQSILTRIVRQHEREFDKNNIRNLVDSYLNEKKMLEEKKDPRSKYFSERSLVHSVLQFYGDGALGAGFLAAATLNAIASRPDTQKAIQAEIDEVVGRNRLPSYDDRSVLSYTNATIYESLRTTMFFPLLSNLECTKDTTLGGCRIPKGTITVFNTWAAFHDPKVYEDPDKFDPTRFLSADGKKPKCEIPALFGVGKRSCIGEPFIMMELMLYVATVLQNFDLHPAEMKETKKELELELDIWFRATPRAP